MVKSQNNTGTQFNIQFESSNPFAEQLRGGKFTLVVECHPPATGQPFESGMAMAKNIAEHIRGLDDITALAVTDRLQSEERYDPAGVADILRNASGKPVVMHMSGKGSNSERIREQASQAASSGVHNILAVTGDRSDKHPKSNALNRSPRYEGGYLDSIDIIRNLRAAEHPYHRGAGVNPYKYNPADQYLQYYKMIRKLNNGAEFLVANFGWDMKKLQELQWYMQMREIGAPVLARVGLLSPAAINALTDNVIPGVPISKSFAALLQRESNVNAAQSLSAQLQRLSLQVVGCRLLGFSGVQLTGIQDPKTLDMVLMRVEETAAKLKSYEEWAEAWHNYHGDLEFAPSSHAYYIFRNLLDPGQQMYDEQECQMNRQDFPAPSGKDRLWAMTFGRLLGPRAPETLRNLAVKLWCRDCREDFCDLRYSNSLCPRSCPKRLLYGACGGSQADGTCEFGHQTCFFHRVLALASIHHDFDRLESRINL
ncbi:MAG: methylenetetrahydrofolate reductase C-terminal domain-containing protein [Lentisphaeria bacterium]